jgi:four helix bundle protein
MWSYSDNQDVGLEAATIQRVRNSSLVKWLCAENVTGLSLSPKLRILEVGNQRSEVGKGSEGMIRQYHDLKVYQESYRLVLEVYGITRAMPEYERRELGYQMRRAAVSIPANIAEGYGRKESAAEFKHFLRNALGSNNEVRVLIDLAHDLGYITTKKHQELSKRYEILGKQLFTLIKKWTKRSDI